MKLRKKPFIFALVTLIILLAPIITRIITDNPTSPIKDNYYYLVDAADEGKNSLIDHPYIFLLSLHRSPYYHLFLPVLLGTVSILLMHQLFLLFRLRGLEYPLFLFALVLSPAFITSFTTLNPNSLLLVILLLGFYLLTRKNTIMRWIALPIFLLVPLFDISSAFLLLVLLIPYTYYKKENIGIISIAGVIIVTILTFLLFGKTFIYTPFIIGSRITELFSDFGGMRGLNIFILLLALGGLVKTWKKLYSFPLYLAVVFLSIMYWMTAEVLLFITCIVTLWAAVAFAHLATKQWKLEAIKNFTLFVLILGVLFSTISVMDRLVTEEPSAILKESLTSLEENSAADEIVLSSLENGELITFYTGRKPFLNYRSENFHERQEISRTLFNSSYLQTSGRLLEEQNITLIFITPDMIKKGVIEDKKGLQFLFKNEKFKMVMDKNETEVWRYEHD